MIRNEMDISQNLDKYYLREGSNWNGKLGFFKVWQRGDYLFFEGSLAKLYFGNNFETLTIEQTRLAVTKLGLELGLDITEANILRIDFATNFITAQSPQNYYANLVELKRHRRNAEGTTLYFNQANKKCVFYDKVAEAKAKKDFIPEGYCNKNVLRYEIRFFKVKRQFGEITAAKLYDFDFFNHLLKIWREYYMSIQKFPVYQLKKESPMLTYKQKSEIGFYFFIQNQFGSIVNYFDFLDRECRNKKISRATKRNWKDHLDNVRKNLSVFESSEHLIQELDRNVNEAFKLYEAKKNVA